MRSNIRIFLSITSLLAWSACSPYSGTNFNLAQVTWVTSEGTHYDPIWNIPQQRVFSFKSCLHDTYSYHSVGPLQEFTIQTDRSEVTVATDVAGCIHWSETLDFDYFSTQGYLKTERTIIGQGEFRGTRTIPLALNPWKQRTDSLIDLRFSSPSQFATHGVSDPSKIVVDQISIQTQEKSYSQGMSTIQLSAHLNNPTFNQKNTEGEIITEPLKSGRFLFRAVLLQSSDVLSKNEQEIELKDGQVDLLTSLTLLKIPRPQIPLEFLFELIPLQAPKTLHGLTATVILPSLILQSRLNIQKLDTNLSQYFSTEKKTSETQQSPSTPLGFDIESVELTSGGESRKTDEGFPSEIQLGIKACLVNSVTQNPIKRHPFSVQFGPIAVAAGMDKKSAFSPKKLMSSLDDGCLRWKEAISFNYYAPPRYLEYFIRVRGQEIPYTDVIQSKKIYINPWKKELSWDERYGDLKNVKSSQWAQLKISSFNYEYVGTQYQINSSLNLTIARKYRITFQPSVIRIDPFSESGFSEIPIHGGKFNLRVALVDEKESSLAPVAYNEFKVSVQENGVAEVVSDFPFPFEKLGKIPARLKIILSLSPIESKSGLRPITGAATFLMPDEKGTSALVESLVNLNELKKIHLATQMEEEQKLQFQENQSSFDAMVRASGLQMLTPEEMKRYQITDELMRKVAYNIPQSTQSLAIRFCHMLSSDKFIKECLIKPEFYFDIRSLKKIETITGKPKAVNQNLSGLGSANFSLLQVQTDYFRELIYSQTKAQSSESTSAHGVEAEGAIGFKVFSAGIAGKAFQEFKSEEKKKNESAVNDEEKSGLRSREVSTLIVQEQKLQFESEVFSCVRSFPTTLAIQSFGAVAQRAKIIYCLPEKKTQQITESWVMIQSNLGTQSNLGSATMLGDSRALQEQSWIMLIRGRATLERFKSVLKFSDLKNQPINLEKRQINTDLPLRTTYSIFNTLYPNPEYGISPSWVEMD